MAETRQQTRAAYVEQVMGLPVSIHLRGPEPRGEQARGTVAEAFALLREADELFSTYRPDSQVSLIDTGRLALADADPLVQQVCALADDAREATDGLFDVHLPVDGRVRFDPSGLVKGWAAERASALLDGLAGHDHCLNAGGDVSLGGAGREPWRVGLEAPGRPGLLGYVERTSGAVATSGTAARGEHLVDPRDGSVPRGLLAATVVGPSLMWADVLATAAYVRGRSAVSWIERFANYEALVVHTDGEVRTSPGFGLHPLD